MSWLRGEDLESWARQIGASSASADADKSIERRFGRREGVCIGVDSSNS